MDKIGAINFACIFIIFAYLQNANSVANVDSNSCERPCGNRCCTNNTECVVIPLFCPNRKNGTSLLCPFAHSCRKKGNSSHPTPNPERYQLFSRREDCRVNGCPDDLVCVPRIFPSCQGDIICPSSPVYRCERRHLPSNNVHPVPPYFYYRNTTGITSLNDTIDTTDSNITV